MTTKTQSRALGGLFVLLLVLTATTWSLMQRLDRLEDAGGGAVVACHLHLIQTYDAEVVCEFKLDGSGKASHGQHSHYADSRQSCQ